MRRIPESPSMLGSGQRSTHPHESPGQRSTGELIPELRTIFGPAISESELKRKPIKFSAFELVPTPIKSEIIVSYFPPTLFSPCQP